MLTLAWAVIGYFGLFDLGLGRAITQSIAERLTRVSAEDVSRLAWTGLLMMLIFASIGTAVVAGLTPWFVSSVLKMPQPLSEETINAFLLLAAAIPAVVLSSGLSGVLAALHRFDMINALRIPMGVMIFVVPLIILPYSKSVAYVCAGLLSVRVLFLLLHLAACFRAYPSLRKSIRIEQSDIKGLLNFGGWISITNVIGPIMMYMDRFVIGAFLTISAVAYYVTPYEIVTRILAIPAAVAAALFPAFAAAKGNGSTHAAVIYSMGARVILVTLAPIALILVVFSKEGLRAWLGQDFAQNGEVVVQWLAIAVFLNGYAQVPYAFVQGIGHADKTAKLHMLEVPIYISLLLWLLPRFGIQGVAIAWLFRAALDAVLLTLLTRWLMKEMAPFSRQILILILMPLIIFAIGMTLDDLMDKLLFISFASPALLLISYYLGLASEERAAIKRLFSELPRT